MSPMITPERSGGSGQPGRKPAARAAYGLSALIAWIGVLLTVILSGLGAYGETTVVPGVYGDHPAGVAGVISRLADTASYFTIWSNVVVAASLTLLVMAPTRDTFWRKVLRLDSLLMITVTAIVYAVLLAPTDVVTGWSRLTNPLLHVITPALTVVVWLAFGPRGWINLRVVLASLGIPLAWMAWMLVRGKVVGAYPYEFLNINEYGGAAVAVTLGQILAFGLLVACIFWGLERVLSRRG